MSFDQLIAGCLKDDKKAQHAFFYSYSRMLMGVAVRYVKDEASAQDVVQESFIRIFKSFNTLKNIEKRTVESWIRKITARESIRWLKNNERYTFHENNDVFTELKTHQPNQLEHKELLIMLRQLPVGYRTIFNLYVIEGYTHREIGELLNITESTSRSQLTRAKKLLQQWIKK